MELPIILYLHDRYVRDKNELKVLLSDKKLIQQDDFKYSFLSYIRDGILQKWLREKGDEILDFDNTISDDTLLYKSVLEKLTGESVEIRKSDFSKVCEAVEVIINGKLINDKSYTFINGKLINDKSYTLNSNNNIIVKFVSKTPRNENFEVKLIDVDADKTIFKRSVDWSDMTKGKEKQIETSFTEKSTIRLIIENNVYGEYQSNFIHGHEYVDLGLESGIKWATCNVGATKPTEYGDYFAWGETKPKKDYSLKTYKLCQDFRMTKYNFIDSKKVLEEVDDAATANWGSEWRMPSSKEIKELINSCTWRRVENFNGSGVNGRLGTSKANGATIFLPDTGCCKDSDIIFGDYSYYWSSSLNDYKVYNKEITEYAYCLRIDYNINCAIYYRHLGLCVRAVLKSK